MGTFADNFLSTIRLFQDFTWGKHAGASLYRLIGGGVAKPGGAVAVLGTDVPVGSRIMQLQNGGYDASYIRPDGSILVNGFMVIDCGETLGSGDNQFLLRFPNASGGLPTVGYNIVISNTSNTDVESLPIVQLGYAPVRTLLTSTLNVYVSTTGSDSNTGLSVGSPFLTLQHAINFLYANYDAGGNNVNINLANGTYTSGGVFSGVLSGLGVANLTLLGNPSTPANVVISVTNAHAITTQFQAIIRVSGITFQTATAGNCLFAESSSIINVTGNCVFGACASYHLNAEGGGIALYHSYSISGNAQTHKLASDCGSIITYVPITITFLASVTFTSSFVWAVRLGDFSSFAETYSLGAFTVTGQRYEADSNGVIDTYGGGATYFPGTVAGATTTGGQYI